MISRVTDLSVSLERTPAHHLHHLRVVEVVDDVLQDVPVRDEPERPEHDHDGDLLLDVRQDRDDPLPDCRLLHVLGIERWGRVRDAP